MTETPNVDPDGTAPVPPPPTPQYGAAPQYVAATPTAPMSDSDQRLWATLAHIGPIILSFIAPLVIWLVYRERGQYVEDQAKEALNFQITLAIASVVVIILAAVTLGIGALLFFPLGIGALVLMIMAAIAANKGAAYRYPVSLRLIK